jgi:glycerol-3-phosphate acyltransferase PlsY
MLGIGNAVATGFGMFLILAYQGVIICAVFLAARSLVRMSESMREISTTLNDISASLRARDVR